jgi:serine/threonine-protein kinase RsbW
MQELTIIQSHSSRWLEQSGWNYVLGIVRAHERRLPLCAPRRDCQIQSKPKPPGELGIFHFERPQEASVPEPTEIPPRCEFEMDKLMIQLDEVFPSAVSMIDTVIDKIMGLIEQSHCWDDTENLNLVLREAVANAIVHGNRSDSQKSVRICVALQTDCRMLIVVKDAGSGFDPRELANPVVGQSLFAEHGRGIFLINRLMEDVQFSFDRGTAIYMRRTLAKRG